ncbi:MAG TPA: tetratricopeptide repeat protein [Sphingomicrobium sp.]|nr:tetratricopeptide repeat protein [Sphingomicrobium sp.]
MRLAHLVTATAIALAGAAPASAQYRRQAQPQYPAAPMVAPATQASVANLDNRIVALERQIADLLRVGEENAHRIGQLEAQLKQQKDDSAARIAALEAQLAAGSQSPVQTVTQTDEPKSAPVNAVSSNSSKPKPTNAVVTTGENDPAEEAYDAGYQLWNAGKYDEAVGALRAFVSAYPSHRRTSWANNLTGRALLDKGEPRAAAEVLLANYRSNPKGERAADSLFYLGQALMKLDQSSQACKAYAELEAVYGSSMRPALKEMLPKAKSEAKCR